jgi:SAM-dependent methyltransferase
VTPEIHPVAAAGFARAADAYERGRPEYPAAAVGWLARELDLAPGRRVLDLAAGTGKLTRALVPTGATVVAVEPVAEMRALIQGVEAFDGRAESIPLPDGWADGVTVAQAFHWFANDEALAEIHRVLAPGGAFALIWNSRDLSDPVQKEIESLLASLAGDARRLYGGGRWRQVIQASPLFGPLADATFPHEQLLDEHGLVDRVLSTSFVASAPREQRDEIAERLRAIAREHDGRVRIPYETSVHVTRRVEAGS